MLIRELERKDLSAIKELAAITWKDTYQALIPLHIQKKTLKQAYSAAAMNKRFENSLMLVAVVQNEIKGYAFLSQEKYGRVHLEALYVHPYSQRKGIGKELIETGIGYFPSIKRITLNILKGNENLSFYEKMGFVAMKEESSVEFSGYPVKFIHMSKKIRADVQVERDHC
ncbi:GNAT family N-acetyltransferase [Sediminibacillus massiliensis]|uniref:GNAT family N-acetyltransferase n=1 Tax=Sediminibacillus massiliensis TaxID=1926277 RepID=UPI0015C32D88|nr:GNAT family N-acetyltransferase [Sediminibacillus massiliensis]